MSSIQVIFSLNIEVCISTVLKYDFHCLWRKQNYIVSLEGLKLMQKKGTSSRSFARMGGRQWGTVPRPSSWKQSPSPPWPWRLWFSDASSMTVFYISHVLVDHDVLGISSFSAGSQTKVNEEILGFILLQLLMWWNTATWKKKLMAKASLFKEDLF